jgi:hypothetical protein
VLVVEIANRGAELLQPLIVDTLRKDLAPRVIYFKNDLPARGWNILPTEDAQIGEGSPSTTILEAVCDSASIRAKDRRPASFSISARTAAWRERSRREARAESLLIQRRVRRLRARPAAHPRSSTSTSPRRPSSWRARISAERRPG